MAKRRYFFFAWMIMSALIALVACLGDGPPVASRNDGGGGADAFADTSTTISDASGDDGASTDSGTTTDAPLDGADADAGITLQPPRPISPLSTATTNSRTPKFTWALPPAGNGDGVQVDICSTRACTTVTSTLQAAAAATSVTATSPLAPGVHFWRLRSTKSGQVASNAGPTWEFFVGFSSPDAAAPTPLSWGTAPDFDGDGVPEIVAGSFYSSQVVIYQGGTTSSILLPKPNADAGLDEQFSIVASAGDLDGDGYPELVVGSYNYNSPPPANGGHAYIYKGGPGGIVANATPTLSIATRPGTLAPTLSTKFGQSVAGVGDVNGDGYGDLVIGSPTYKLDTDGGAAGGACGAIFVVHGGPTLSTLTITSALTEYSNNCYYFGARVGAAGDVNGDGFADVVVAGDYNLGNYVFLGSANGLKDTNGAGAPVAFNLIAPANSTLNQVFPSTTPGDVNGDGLSDVIIGDPGGGVSARGQVSIYLGSSSFQTAAAGTVEGPVGASGFGFSVAIVGDVDKNGVDDVFVGAPVAPGNAYYLPATKNGFGISAAQAVKIGAPSGVTITADGDGNRWGFAVSAVGDFDKDGMLDVVTAPALGEKIFVFSGQPTGGLDETKFTLLNTQIGPLPSLALLPVPWRWQGRPRPAGGAVSPVKKRGSPI